MRHFFHLVFALTACFLPVFGQEDAAGVHVIMDTSQAPDLTAFGDHIQPMMQAWYDSLWGNLFSESYVEPDNITVTFTNTLHGVTGYTYPFTGKILINADYYRELNHQENDTGSLFHELVHVVQQYKPGCPKWFYEGFADDMRYYNYVPHEIDQVPTKPMQWAGEHYSQGYGPAAYFLHWLIYRSKHEDVDLIMDIHFACRNGNYSDDIFLQNFGKTKDELWEQMIYSEPDTSFWAHVRHAPDDLWWEAHELSSKMNEVYFLMKEFLDSPTYEPLDVMYFDILEENSGEGLQVSPAKKTIRGGADYLRETVEDRTQLMDGMARILQQYPERGDDTSEWIISGIAKLAVYDSYPESHQHLQKPPPGSHYIDGDWVAAYFFQWLDRKYRPHGKRVSYWLNRKIREGTFTEREWLMMTGRTVDQLWERMVREENI